MVEETCERDFSSARAFEMLLKLFIDFLLLSWKLVYTYNILCVLMLFIVCEDHDCVAHVDHLFNCHLCTAEVKDRHDAIAHEVHSLSQHAAKSFSFPNCGDLYANSYWR